MSSKPHIFSLIRLFSTLNLHLFVQLDFWLTTKMHISSKAMQEMSLAEQQLMKMMQLS